MSPLECSILSIGLWGLLLLSWVEKTVCHAEGFFQEFLCLLYETNSPLLSPGLSLCVPTLGNIRSLPALGLYSLPPVVEVGIPSQGPLARAECWHSCSLSGHRVGHAIESTLSSWVTTALGAFQDPGNHSGQLSHSNPFFPPWPVVCVQVA